MDTEIEMLVADRPTVRYFIVASCDLAERNIERASRKLPKPQRGTFRRRKKHAHHRRLNKIIEDAPKLSVLEIKARVSELEWEGSVWTESVADAQAAADRFGNEIADSRMRGGRRMGVGITSGMANSEVAFVWLWPD